MNARENPIYIAPCMSPTPVMAHLSSYGDLLINQNCQRLMQLVIVTSVMDLVQAVITVTVYVQGAVVNIVVVVTFQLVTLFVAYQAISQFNRRWQVCCGQSSWLHVYQIVVIIGLAGTIVYMTAACIILERMGKIRLLVFTFLISMAKIAAYSLSIHFCLTFLTSGTQTSRASLSVDGIHGEPYVSVRPGSGSFADSSEYSGNGSPSTPMESEVSTTISIPTQSEVPSLIHLPARHSIPASTDVSTVLCEPIRPCLSQNAEAHL
mmetsp:Transcript_14371/g.27619  ORF Transcript_14371/g.27619 Transcript_14371/m.27619 type:complete len:264 (+) Transcript_14371:232-1023(+)